MSPNDNAGRIHKPAFVASIVALFALVFVTLAIRLLIRIRVQRQFGLDDGFLLFGTASLIAATGILFSFVDGTYTIEALLTNMPGQSISANFIQGSGSFHVLNDVCLILLWTTVFAVKFSFLSLFRKLVDRTISLTRYWKIVTTVTAIVWAYGIGGFIAPCPYFTLRASIPCAHSSELPKTVGLSALLVVLDIMTDIMIIALPVTLIWRIQIQLKQKLALLMSLCLSIVMIIVTLVRTSGLIFPSPRVVDVVWSLYWQYVEASVAIIMASLTAFRTLFVKQNFRSQRPHKETWYSGYVGIFRQILTTPSWRKSPANRQDLTQSNDGLQDIPRQQLPKVPRPTMRGIHIFITGRNPIQPGDPLSLHGYDQTPEEEIDRVWQEHQYRQHPVISIQHDVTIASGRVSCESKLPRSHIGYV